MRNKRKGKRKGKKTIDTGSLKWNVIAYLWLISIFRRSDHEPQRVILVWGKNTAWCSSSCSSRNLCGTKKMIAIWCYSCIVPQFGEPPEWAITSCLLLWGHQFCLGSVSTQEGWFFPNPPSDLLAQCWVLIVSLSWITSADHFKKFSIDLTLQFNLSNGQHMPCWYIAGWVWLHFRQH